MPKGMSSRSTRSSVASDEVASSSATTTTPNEGNSVGGSAPKVSSQGVDPLQGLKGHGPQQGFHSKSLFPKELPSFNG